MSGVLDIEAQQPQRQADNDSFWTRASCYSCRMMTTFTGSLGFVASTVATVAGGVLLGNCATADVCPTAEAAGYGALVGVGLISYAWSGGLTYVMRKLDIQQTASVLRTEADQTQDAVVELADLGQRVHVAAQEQTAVTAETAEQLQAVQEAYEELKGQFDNLRALNRRNEAIRQVMAEELENHRILIQKAMETLSKAESQLGAASSSSDKLSKENDRLIAVTEKIDGEIGEQEQLVVQHREQTAALGHLVGRLQELLRDRDEAEQAVGQLRQETEQLREALRIAKEHEEELESLQQALHEAHEREQVTTERINQLEELLEKLANK